MKRSFRGSTFKSTALSLPSVEIDDMHLIPVEDIQFKSEIGEGSSARVFQGVFNNSPVALKRFKLGKGVPKYQSMLKKEAKNMLSLKHRNVVECLGVCVAQMTLVLEYCCKSLSINGENVSCHTVRQMIDTIGQSMPEDLRHEALYQMTNGMVYLHAQDVIHCDLKSQNVLVGGDPEDDDEWVFKISDMGEAHVVLDTTYKSTISQTQRGAVGTIPYQAPELLHGKPQYRKPVDVYSFAMVMYELAHEGQQYPWHKDCCSSSDRIRGLVTKGERPAVDTCISVWYVDLMKQCWQQEPMGRPSFEEILQRLDASEVDTNNNSVLSPKKLSKNMPPVTVGIPKFGLLQEHEHTSPEKDQVRPRREKTKHGRTSPEEKVRSSQENTEYEQASPDKLDVRSNQDNTEYEQTSADKFEVRSSQANTEDEQTSSGKLEVRSSQANTEDEQTSSDKLEVRSSQANTEDEQTSADKLEVRSNQANTEDEQTSADKFEVRSSQANTEDKQTSSDKLEVRSIQANTEDEQMSADKLEVRSNQANTEDEQMSADKLEVRSNQANTEDEQMSADKLEVRSNQDSTEHEQTSADKLEVRSSQDDTKDEQMSADKLEVRSSQANTEDEHTSLDTLEVRSSQDNTEHEQTSLDKLEVKSSQANTEHEQTSADKLEVTSSQDNTEHEQMSPDKLEVNSSQDDTEHEQTSADKLEIRSSQDNTEHEQMSPDKLEVRSTQENSVYEQRSRENTEARERPGFQQGTQEMGVGHTSSQSEKLVEPTEEMLMSWAGYALKYFKIAQLHEYQTSAVASWRTRLDCLIIHSTSSGKSICFQLPAAMGKNGEMVVVVVPTIAIAKDQVQYLNDVHVGVKAQMLGSGAEKGAFANVFSNKARPKILYVTPETLMGGDTYKGIVGKLQEAHNSGEFRVTLFAIDEAHLIWEWGGNFRASFDKLCQLKVLFPDIPVMAVTATLQPKDEEMMKTIILHDPVVLRGSVDRPNVCLRLFQYKPPRGAEGDWTPVAEQIRDVVGQEEAIIYCSFATTCDSVCAALLQCGVKSAAYTGHNRTAEEKHTIHENMTAGEIQVLVATQAFGLGVSIKWIRWVIHIGCPPNLSLWVQESGRAGRDGKPASAAIFLNEHADLQRLKFWVKDASLVDKTSKTEDFKKVWQYVYRAMAGMCLHQQHRMYFGEKDETPLKHADHGTCCDGCEINDARKENVTKEMKMITRALHELHKLGLSCVTEIKLLDWLEGKENGWLQRLSTPDALTQSDTFGQMSKYQKRLKVLIRQALGLNIVSLVILISKVQGHWDIVTKYFACNNETEAVLEKMDKVEVPNIEYVRKHMDNSRDQDGDEAASTNPVDHSRSPGTKANNRVIRLLEERNWETITRKEQYLNLGFQGGHNNLLYAADFTKVTGCPVALNKEDFMWNDITMGKGSGFPKKTHQLDLGGKELQVVIQKNYCSGVKTCSAPCCSFATSNKQRHNRCLRHEDSVLKSSGKCNGVFVYVRPKESKDVRRWLGFLTKNDGGHNHPCPITTKPGSKVEEMVAECVRRDPTKTPRDLAKGYGLPCLPGAISVAAANTSCLANIRNKYLIDTGSATTINLVKRFDVLIKSQIDDADSVYDENNQKQINEMTTPYLRSWEMTDDMFLAVFLTPQMSQTFSLSVFVEADVTFPGCQVLKYLLNIVTFNELTLKWQVVARALVSRMTTTAYKAAFRKILDVVTAEHPEFKRGQETVAWVVDFSDAQAAALEETLGEMALKVIRGCKVHYIRLCHKIAEKVCAGPEERNLFLHISAAIPDLAEPAHVNLLFDVLCGATSPSELPSDILELSQDQRELECAGWKAATSWVTWWKRPRHQRMICSSMKNMNDSIWKISPSTTNAVESKNKDSKPQTTSVKATLEHIYRCDRAAAYEVLAAESGISVAPSKSRREKCRRARKNWRRKKSRAVASAGSGEMLNMTPEDRANLADTSRRGTKRNAAVASGEMLNMTHEDQATMAGPSRKTAKINPPAQETELTVVVKSAESEEMLTPKDIPAGPSIKAKKRKSPRHETRPTGQEVDQVPVRKSVPKRNKIFREMDETMVGKKILVDTVGARGKLYGFQEGHIVGIERCRYKIQYKSWPTHFAFLNDLHSDGVVLLDGSDHE